jgi:hypothetical protein
MAILDLKVGVFAQDRVLGQVRQSREVPSKQQDSARRPWEFVLPLTECGPDSRHIEIPPLILVWIPGWRGQAQLSSGKSAAEWVVDLQWKNTKLARALGVDCSRGDEDPSWRNWTVYIWHSSAMRAIRTPRDGLVVAVGACCLGVVVRRKDDGQNFHQ